jgi:hypothetical protein
MRSTYAPIPVHTPGGIARRQCTDKWKIRPIEVWLHKEFGRRTPLVAQLGMTIEEAHRIRDPRSPRNRNRFPLVDLRLRRSDCEEIIRMAGLPVPPWSACAGCPLQDQGRWRRVATEWPDDFAEAVELDHLIRERSIKRGTGPIWLSRMKKPLHLAFSSDQQVLFQEEDDGSCESGYCFT